jgi:hypothetical protein
MEAPLAFAEEYTAVAVLAALAWKADETAPPLPPLWPRVLHFVSDLVLPVVGPARKPHVRFVPGFIRALASPVHSRQHGGALGIRRVLDPWCDHDRRGGSKPMPVDDVISAGAVPLLAMLLADDNAVPAAQLHAGWVISFIASQSLFTRQVLIMNTPGLVESLVRLLGFPDREVCVYAVAAIGRLAGSLATRSLGRPCRDHLLERGALSEMIRMMPSLTQRHLTLRRDAMWAIAELCCELESSSSPSLAEIAIPFAAEMIQFPDAEIARDAMRTLSYLSRGLSAATSWSAIDHNAVTSMLQCLPSRNRESPAESHVLPSLFATFGSNAEHITSAIHHGVIPVLCAMLETRPQLTEAILQVLSRMAGSNAQHVRALLDAGVFNRIAAYIASKRGRESARSQRAVWKAIGNADADDRVTIIRSDSFRELCGAATTQRLMAAGAEALEQAFAHGIDTVMTTASLDKLTLVVDAVCASTQPGIRICGGRMRAQLSRATPTLPAM